MTECKPQPLVYFDPILRPIGYRYNCFMCKKPQEMEESQVKWFRDKGFTLPTKCTTCKRKKEGSKVEAFKTLADVLKSTITLKPIKYE